jgi:multidrug efflux pump subunit AcrA (membrane-fusion protein)
MALVLMLAAPALATPAAKGAPSVKRVKPLRRTVTHSLTLSATLTPTLWEDLTTHATGWVSALFADGGSAVKKGQVLATVEPVTHSKPVPIVAPFDGEIRERMVELGGYVSVGGTPLFAIVNNDHLLVRAGVPERDCPKIRVGQHATLEVVAYPNRAYQAAVLRTIPEIVDDAMPIEVAVDNPDRSLLPGMTARVLITTGEASNALTLPRSAVQRDGASVLLLEGDRARRAPIQVAPVDDETVEVLGGIAADATVLIGDGLRDGDHVAP